MLKSKNQNLKFATKLKNKTILITGGSGSLGIGLAKELLKYPVKAIRLLDINEHSLFQTKRTLNDSRIRPLLGSITNEERLDMACKEVDIIFHTAAIKNLEISEFNPIETIETNITGTVNLIKTTIKNNPKIFVNISTDKAAEPSTLYGTTKQLSERLTSWAGNHIPETKYASIRLGNIIETRGNVFEIWNDEKNNKKPLSITDPKMERYFFHMDEAVNFILECLILMKSGEIFIPKMKLTKISNLAKTVSNSYKITGTRQGEKLSEILITESEKKNATEMKNMWIIKQYTI